MQKVKCDCVDKNVTKIASSIEADLQKQAEFIRQAHLCKIKIMQIFNGFQK